MTSNSIVFRIKSVKGDSVKVIISNDSGNESEMSLKKYYDEYLKDLIKRTKIISYLKRLERIEFIIIK